MCGCNKQEPINEEKHEYGYYTVDYAKSCMNYQGYDTDTTDEAQLVNELVSKVVIENYMKTIEKPTISITNEIVYLNYTAEYTNIDTITEVLYRAAMVKTLTQLEKVSYVYFYVEGQPLKYADGTTVGMMTASDFVEDTDDSINNLIWTEITLYFADETGQKLVENTIEVAYKKTASLERLVVEQLIDGPDTAGSYAVLPSGLKVLSISVKDGVCYVNFDSTFLSETANVSSEVSIYAIVNSLCELTAVNKVQIMVNGDSQKVFRDSISLDTLFERNLDLIQEDIEEKESVAN